MAYASDQLEAEWQEWLATRPEAVRTIARRYPPGTKFLLHGLTMHVIAYSEDGGLSVTPTDPVFDYES